MKPALFAFALLITCSVRAQAQLHLPVRPLTATSQELEDAIAIVRLVGSDLAARKPWGMARVEIARRVGCSPTYSCDSVSSSQRAIILETFAQSSGLPFDRTGEPRNGRILLQATVPQATRDPLTVAMTTWYGGARTFYRLQRAADGTWRILSCLDVVS